jgi:hypothetical protein
LKDILSILQVLFQYSKDFFQSLKDLVPTLKEPASNP